MPVTVSPVMLTILSLQLLYFDITALPGGNVQLNWATNSELNTSNFEIEYFDNNARTWKKVGEQKAAGTSRSSKKYSFIATAEEGINQFRLKQIFQNGSFVYSPVNYLNISRSNERSFIYNPSSREIILGATNGSNYHVRLVSMAGNVIINNHITSNAPKIKVPAMPAGIYVVSISNSTGRCSAGKLFIP
jgi:hypothetical protein